MDAINGKFDALKYEFNERFERLGKDSVETKTALRRVALQTAKLTEDMVELETGNT